MMGIGTSTATLTSFAGSDANGYGFQCDVPLTRSDWYFNGMGHGADPFVYCRTGDVMGVAVDVAAQLIWITNVTQGGGWNAGLGRHARSSNRRGRFIHLRHQRADLHYV